MDTVKKRPSKAQKASNTQAFTATTIPVYLLSKCLALIRPFAPQLIPLVVFAFLIPLVLSLSAAAGYAVWKNVAVGWEMPLYLQYGDGQSPYASTILPALTTKQPYDISMRLTVPATNTNFALGNFMASLRLASASNKTLASVRRPAIVMPPRSTLFGVKSATTTLDILLLPAYTPGASHIEATVQLGRQDSWKTLGSGEGREVAVFDAYLHGVVVHQGIRGLVTRFPLLSALAASSTFLVVLLSVMGLCILPTMLPEGPPQEAGYESFDEQVPAAKPKRLSMKQEEIEEEAPRRRRVPRGSRSTSRRSQVKQETEDDNGVPMPGPSSSTPLRRRRSGISGSESES
ncbi:hypothetical protein BDZ89DRAFT_1078162 [Hymenopellis radicata]|nr:hypothetical protein BDZ89DRAFT_1078162 [Hymenopellis radicata]